MSRCLAFPLFQNSCSCGFCKYFCALGGFDLTTPRYIDVSCRPQGTTESLFEYVLRSGNPALHPDRLHRCARLWGRCFYGQQYPDQQVSDDMENYRGLELLHVGISLRYKTWQALVDDPGRTSFESESLFNELMSIHDVSSLICLISRPRANQQPQRYSDLFITAKFAGPTSVRRALNTINMAVTTFYAQVLFHRRLLRPPGPPSTIHRHAVTNILEITHKQYISDPRLLRRLHWPLLMAAIETEDPGQRDWICQRLSELRKHHSEYRWAHDLADEVLARQDASQGQYVDLAEILRNQDIFAQKL